MYKLVAFAGRSGAGKTTAADHMVQNHRFFPESFSHRPKKALQQMFGVDALCLYGESADKRKPIPQLSKRGPVSGAQLLQTFMTDWAQNMIDPDIWIYPVEETWNTMKNVPGFAGMVISDVRFDQQAKWVIDNGGVVIDIRSKDSIRESHPSESGISPKYLSSFVLNEKDGLGTFYEAIDHELEILRRIKNGTSMLEERRGGQGDTDDSERQDIRRLITEWADSVFPNRTITNAIHKMVLEEIPEYLVDQSNTMELADIGILLYDIAHLAGIDLDRAIRQKMIINKGRKWRIDENTGLMNHYDEGTDAEKIKYSPDILSQYAEAQAAESEGGEA